MSTTDGTAQTAHFVLQAAGYTITCSTGVQLHGTMTGEHVTELTLTPEFFAKDCKDSATKMIETPVSMGTCSFKVQASGPVDIVHGNGAGSCESMPITVITGAGCTIEIAPQNNLSEWRFHNINGFTEITAEQEVKAITGTAKGAGCIKAGAFKDGFITTGNVILKGQGANISWSA